MNEPCIVVDYKYSLHRPWGQSKVVREAHTKNSYLLFTTYKRAIVHFISEVIKWRVWNMDLGHSNQEWIKWTKYVFKEGGRFLFTLLRPSFMDPRPVPQRNNKQSKGH